MIFIVILLILTVLINWFGAKVPREEKVRSEPLGINTTTCSHKEAFKGSRNGC